jgi:hypothetical protein
MTFSQLVVHMTETNYFLCSKTTAVTAPKIEGVNTDSKDKLAEALKAFFQFCSYALAKMDDSKLSEITNGLGGEPVTRASFSLVLAGTWADHYAETAMYLRLNNILPRIGRNEVEAVLASDPNLMQETGRGGLAATLSHEYGFTDIDGKRSRPLGVTEA